MSILNDLAALGRPRFFDGQRLAAPDLQAVDGLNREMRWLHNQSLHQPGIGNGYAVTGAKGDGTVVVGPGYALDADGHEIVLTATRTLPIPPVAGEPDGSPSLYDLTVSYVADADLTASETRAGDCGPGGAVRLPENPLFCWVHMRANQDPAGTITVDDPAQRAAVEQGRMIVLARVQILNCQLNADADTTVRRSARPEQQPYIACGQAPPGGWKTPLVATPGPAGTSQPRLLAARVGTPEPAAAAAGGPGPVLIPFVAPLKLTATICTDAARFRSTPQYTARIAYPPDAGRLVDLTYDANTTVSIFLTGIVNVLNPQPNQFEAEVLVLLVPAVAADELTLLMRPLPNDFDTTFGGWFQDWGVVWMGVEG